MRLSPSSPLGKPLPADLADELEKLFAIAFLGIDKKRSGMRSAIDAFVFTPQEHGFAISLPRTLTKIHASKVPVIACFQGRAPFTIVDIDANRREQAFSRVLMSEAGEMFAIFVPTFEWTIIRNHDTPPAHLFHLKARRLRERADRPMPEVPLDRVDALCDRIAEMT